MPWITFALLLIFSSEELPEKFFINWSEGVKEVRKMKKYYLELVLQIFEEDVARKH